MNRRSLAALLGGCALTGACYDLEISAVQPTQGTTYTRAEILADPVLLEHLVAGSFVNFWAAAQHESPWTVFSIFGEEFTTSAIQFSSASNIWDRIQEPRGRFDNELGNQLANQTAKQPWAYLYEANSTAAEFGGIIKRENIRIIDPATGIDNTVRLLAFAKWVQGLSHIHLALIFDSAAIINEDIDLSVATIQPLRGYQEVLDSGIKWLEEAIQMATVNTFLYPLNEGQWVYNAGFDNGQMRAVSHSYIARALVYSARTPAERLAVDWNRVKQHLALGITTKFGPRGVPDNSNVSFLYRRAASAPPATSIPGVGTICTNNTCSGQGLMRVDTRIVGPADTSGVYQEWLAKVSGARFDTVGPIAVSTPDQRIQPAGNVTPLIRPTYFKFTDVYPAQSQMDTSVRGKYYVSFYWNSTRARNNGTQYPNTGGGRQSVNNNGLTSIQDEMMFPVEMDLLLAEAHIRSTPPDLAAAAALINRSREQFGILPAVTAAGVPVENSCVPQRWDGTCGDLFDALMYEKRIETYGTAIAFFDARGWGCLLEGTPTQLPIPSTQLDLMKHPSYTYGGQAGQPGSAAKPNNCPILFKPT